jgi:hypothetical protein
MELVMALRFSAILGLLFSGGVTALLLLPAQTTSISLVGSTPKKVIATAAGDLAAEPSRPQIAFDPGQAKLETLVWRRGKKRPDQLWGVSPNLPMKSAPAPAHDNAVAALTPNEVSAAASAQPEQNFFVATSAVYVHASPNGQSARIFTLQRGESVSEVSTTANWLQVKTSTGATGWVYSTFLASNQPVLPSTVEAATNLSRRQTGSSLLSSTNM